MDGMITKRQLDNYSQSLKATVKASSNGLEKSLQKAVNGFLNANDEDERSIYRDAIINEVYSRIERYRNVMFLRMDDWDELVADVWYEQHETYPIEYVENHVRYAAKFLFESQSAKVFIDELKMYIERVVNDAKFT